MTNQLERIRSALAQIPADDRTVWLRAGMALKSELGEDGFPIWDTWSRQAESYRQSDANLVWRSIDPQGRTTIATLFYEARAKGWRDDQPYREPTPEQKIKRMQRRTQAEAERLAQEKAQAIESRALWDKATAADALHPYLLSKHVKPHNLRQYARMLTIPLVDLDGVIWNVQRIFPDGAKLFRPGRARGLFSTIGAWTDPNTLLICEGWATGATLHEQTDYPVLCAMNAGNLLAVAQVARSRWPNADMVICGDDDRDTAGNPGRTAATKAAQATGARLSFPDFGPDEIGSDFNDWANARVLA